MALPRSSLRRAAKRPRSRGSTPTGPTAGNAPEPLSRPMASGSRSCAGPATARPAPCTIRNARSGRSPFEALLLCPNAGSSSEHTPGTSAGVAWSCTTTARPQPLLPGSGSLRRASPSADSLPTVYFVYTLEAVDTAPTVNTKVKCLENPGMARICWRMDPGAGSRHTRIRADAERRAACPDTPTGLHRPVANRPGMPGTSR